MIFAILQNIRSYLFLLVHLILLPTLNFYILIFGVQFLLLLFIVIDIFLLLLMIIVDMSGLFCLNPKLRFLLVFETSLLWLKINTIPLLKLYELTMALNSCFMPFMHPKEIIHIKSCVEIRQQNGRVERKHQHILNVGRGRALLFQSKFPKSKSYVVLHAVFLVNRVTTPLLKHQSPFSNSFWHYTWPKCLQSFW